MSEHRATPDITNPENLDVFEITSYMLDQEGYNQYNYSAKLELLGKLAATNYLGSMTPYKVGQRFVAEDCDPDHPEYFVLVGWNEHGEEILVPEDEVDEHFENERSWERGDDEDGV